MNKVPPNSADGAEPKPGQPRPGEPAWSEDIRAYYQAAAQEPVPQDFLDLMAQIAKQIEK